MTKTGVDLFIIRVAEDATLSVKQLVQSSVARNRAHVDLEIESNGRSAKVQTLNRTANLVQTSRQVLLLPLPKNMVKLPVVEVEERVWYEKLSVKAQDREWKV
jgi:hypothetical protein